MRIYGRASGQFLSRRLFPTLLFLQVIAGTTASAQNGPGAFDVDPEAAERALERTLVETGVLLLPRGTFEIEPSLRYEYSETEQFVLGQINGDFVLDRQLIERDELMASLDLRYGLPGDAQLELTVPLIFANQSVDETIFASGNGGDVKGLGDVRVGFAKTLVRESNGVPDIVGRLTWDTDWGKDTSGPVSITSDFNEIQLSLSALWRLDPVALTAGLAYEHALEKDNIQPGDVVGIAVGASLAASPTVALGMSFNASYRMETEFNGQSIDDSDQNQASISFSISNTLSRNSLLSIKFGAGLTEDSPDYFASVSLPIRF